MILISILRYGVLRFRIASDNAGGKEANTDPRVGRTAPFSIDPLDKGATACLNLPFVSSNAMKFSERA
jgi:hypothetical protein